ncbi:MAG: hypothetical protein ACK4LQ_12920 [Pararhodobacter sp.]
MNHHTTRQPLPPLVRLYLRQVAIGFGLAAVFVGLILMLDVARLRSLVMATQAGWMALFLLFFFNGLVFAGVQFGIRVMRMAAPEDGDGGGRRGVMRRSDTATDAARPVCLRVAGKVAGPQRP